LRREMSSAPATPAPLCGIELRIFHAFSDVCFIWILRVFHLDVAYVTMAIHVCYKCMFQMFKVFQTYVTKVLSRRCICCRVYVSNVSLV
jgi:hypothetical protein